MNSIDKWLGASAMAVAMSFCPQDLFAESFSGDEFLSWTVEGQNNYIGTAVTMASFVATRTNQQMADCLNQWYAASENLAEQRNREIRDTISRNAQHHPSAVILLVLEKACGSFKAP